MSLGENVDRNCLPEDWSQVSAHGLRRPFYLEAEGAKAGILLVHGFTGTPFEMRFLGEALFARGYTVYAPLLSGHATTSEALAASSWKEWSASVDAAATLLRAKVPKMCVVGLSLGGLLTLELARHRGEELVAIASLSAPLWFRWPIELLIKITRLTGRAPTVAIPKGAGSDIADSAMRQRNNLAQGNIGLPVKAVLSLREFMDHVKEGLGDVKVPTLAMHARQDHTAPFACLATIEKDLGTRDVETISLERSFHVVTLDIDRDRVVEAVAAHFARHLST